MVGVEDHFADIILIGHTVALAFVLHGGAVFFDHRIVGALALRHGDPRRRTCYAAAGAVKPRLCRPAVEGQGHIG